TPLHRLLAVLACAGTLTACAQGEGDRCQLDSDCAMGLVCAVPAGERTVGGSSPDTPATASRAPPGRPETPAPGTPATRTPGKGTMGVTTSEMGPPEPDLSMPDLMTPDLLSSDGA